MSVSNGQKSSFLRRNINRLAKEQRLAVSRKVRRSLFLESLEARQVMAGNVIATPIGPTLLLSNAIGGDPEEIQISLAGGNYIITGLNGTLINGAASDSFADAAIANITTAPGFLFEQIRFQTAINPADSALAITNKLTLADAAAHVVTLTADDANGYDGNTNGNISFLEVDEISAGANAGDALLTYNTQTDWTINEGAGSSLKAATSTLKFSGFEQLIGNSAADDFVVADPGAVAFGVAGGGGTNSLNLSSVSGANVNLTNVAAVGADGSETTESITFFDIHKLTADGTSTLNGLAAGGTWVIDDSATNTYATNLSFSGFKTLNGGAGIDIFNVRNNTALSYTLNGGAGVDQFNIGSTSNKLDSIANLTVNGGTNSATLTLNDQGNSTDLNYSVGATTIGRTLGGAVTYSTITNLALNAGSGKNKVAFTAAPTASGTKSFNMSTGDDTVDLSALASANLTGLTKNAIAGGFDLTATVVGTFTSINEAVGSAAGGADSITGIDDSATWTINEGATSNYVAGQTLKFTKFEKLNGGNNTDAFTVTDPATAAFTLAGGGGTNSLDLTAVAAANVTLTNVDADGADGTETTKSITFSDIKTLTADGTGTLTGTSTSATWNINDLASNTYATDLSFKGFNTLTGGDGQDTFEVRNNTVVSYTLNGGKSVDAFNIGSVDDKLDSIANIAVNGGIDGATLTLNDQGSTTDLNYSVGATTIGRTGGGAVTHSGITDLALNAGSGKSKFSVAAVPTVSGTKTLNGGLGSDTLDLSGFGVSAVTITDGAAVTGFDGNFSGVDFTGIEAFLGVTASTFTGDDADSNWTINDGGTSTYATLTRTANISGFNILQGGSAKDTFNVLNNTATANYLLKGGAGLDQFNFGSANNLNNITQPISVDGEADLATLTLSDSALGTSIDYTAGATTIGRTGGGTVTYGGISTLSLTASNGSNIITITAMPTAAATTLNGGTGDDTLDVSLVNPVEVTVTAVTAIPSTTGFNGNVASGGKSFDFTGVEAISADAATGDKLNGIDAASTWTIDESAGNSSKYALTANLARALRFSGIDALQGQSAVDTVNVLDNSTTANMSLKGGGSLDAFNFGNGNKLDGVTNAISVDGEGASATLTLNDQANAINFNYTAGANTIGRDGGGTVTYSAINNLTLNASNGSNTIKVAAVPTATGTKTFNGGTGDDVLDLTALATTDVTLTANNATKGFNGTVAGVADFTGVEEIKGNGAGDLTGLANENATWTINDTTGHTYVSSLPRTLKFSGFDNLNGGTKVDTFKVQNNATSNTFTLDGKAGGDKFLIGDTVNKLAGLKNLNVIGGADVGDELTLNDQAEAGANDYTITATTAADDGGVVVTHTTVEQITLNASLGANAIKVNDGAYNPATTIKLVDATGASTLAVDDSLDASGNTWSVSSSQVVRTAPAPSLTIDYSSQATITSLSLTGGTAIDNVTVNSTKVATTVNGNDGNDVFTVGNGDLDNFAGQLTINGGTHNLADTRTVFKGGDIPLPTEIVFKANSSAVAKGDTLTVSDALQTGVTKYAVNSTTVSRTGAAKSVTYSNIELLNVLAGKDESDVTITMPTAAPDLPFVVSIDGGTAAKDNRVQIKGTDAVDKITVGNATAVETNRSQFEVTSVTRLWVEGGKEADIIHNRSSVPGLLDGGNVKTTKNVDPGNQDDVIASDAPSTTTFSPVLLGNDGLDFLYTTNSSTAGTTYLVGDYFINNNVPLTAGSAAKTSRLQVVYNPAGAPGLRDGQTGDRYITNHTPATALKNRILARLDTNFNAYSGRFANLTADTIGNHLGVIEWLRGRLPLTVSAAGMSGELARINYQVRLFVREPGSAAAPAFPNATYNPGGVASGGSVAGGEAVGDELEPTPLVQNPFDAADVNGDGRITAFDAILIINELNSRGVHQLDTSPDGEYGVNGGGAENKPLDFLDVNGDSAVSAFDAILVINRLNGGGGAGSYEMPNPLDWFAEADAAEQAASDFAASQFSSLPNSVSDDALLALLAAQGEEQRDE